MGISSPGRIRSYAWTLKVAGEANRGIGNVQAACLQFSKARISIASLVHPARTKACWRSCGRRWPPAPGEMPRKPTVKKLLANPASLFAVVAVPESRFFTSDIDQSGTYFREAAVRALWSRLSQGDDKSL